MAAHKYAEAHEHAEMIKAKAYNMDLVVFVKAAAHGGEWLKIDWCDFPTNPHQEYFLCHPKHADVCLHWLNGGEIDISEKDGANVKWTPIKIGHTWNGCHPLMNSFINLRIKPRKEKRWVGVNNKDDVARGKAYTSKELAKESVMFPDDWQFIEIEVEV